MKKVSLILGIILFLVGIIGGAGVIASQNFFLSEEEFMEKFSDKLQTIKEDYTGNPDRIDIDAISADIVINYSKTNKISVEYIGKVPGITCSVSYDNGMLEVRENSSLFMSFMIPASGRSELTVTLPEKYLGEQIDEFSLYMTSGTLSGDIPKTEKTVINFTSGSTDNITMDCEYANLKITSGNLHISNRGEKMKEVIYEATSGKAELVKFSADKISFDVTSGYIFASGLTGEVKLDKTSGDTRLDYAKLGGNLYIDSTSGSNEINFPADAGFDLVYECTSGSCKVATPIGDDFSVATFTDDATMHVGEPSDYKVEIDVTSGKTTINCKN